MKINIFQEVSRIRMKLVMQSMTREIQRRSDEGDLMT